MRTELSKGMLFAIILLLLAPLSIMEHSGLGGVFDMGQVRKGSLGYREDTEGVGISIMSRPADEEDLSEIMEVEGVYEEEVDYTPVIDGHGTGLRPPTEEKWEEFGRSLRVVEGIYSASPMALNTSKMLNATNYFPPIGNQGAEGSCSTWSFGYYTKTFQEAKERDWNLSGATYVGSWPGQPAAAYQDRIMSPDFIYHQVNNGGDSGSYFSDNVGVCRETGICSWKNMPYDCYDHTTWPSEAAWREAPYYRVDDVTYFMWVTDNTALTGLKTWVDGDNLASISINAYEYPDLVSTTGGDLWTVEVDCGSGRNHANTIIGYDDNFGPYTEESTTRYGAFLVANSWGKGWNGDSNSNGMYWLSYECMKRQVQYIYFMTDLIDYEPKMLSVFNITHSSRGDCQILFGIGDSSSPYDTKRFEDYNFRGGTHPFPSNLMVQDMTEFFSSVSSIYGKEYFMRVYDAGSTSTGTITNFTVEVYDDYSSGLPIITAVSGDTDLSTVQSGAVTAKVRLIDTIPPDVLEDLTPENATTGDPLNFTVRVRDNDRVGEVRVEYWNGTGPRTNSSMRNDQEDLWSLNISAPHTLSNLTYRFFANDTAENLFVSEPSQVNMTDNDIPQLELVEPPLNGTTGDMMYFTAWVMDNIELENVELRYSYGGGEVRNVPMSPSGDGFWNTALQVGGGYRGKMYYRALAVDTSGNANMTANASAIITDDDAPVFKADLTSPEASTGDRKEFIVKVMDNLQVGSVLIDYRFGDNPEGTLTMEPSLDGMWVSWMEIPHDLAPLRYSFRAVDTSDNWNHTPVATIRITDNDLPVLVEDIRDNELTTGDPCRMGFNLSDNIGVVSADLHYRFDAGEWSSLSLVNEAPNIWSETIRAPQNDTYRFDYYVVMEDLAGNINTTGQMGLPVLDNDAPLIEDVNISGVPTTGDPFEILVASSDNIRMGAVMASYRFGDNGSMNVTLSDQGDGIYRGIVQVPPDCFGGLHIQVLAADDNGNVNSRALPPLEVLDNDAPDLIEWELIDTPSTGDPLDIRLSCRDNIGVTSVWVEYRFQGEMKLVSLSGSKGNWTGTLLLPGAIQLFDFSLNVTDQAGNLESVYIEGVRVIDNDPPIMGAHPDITALLGERLTLSMENVQDNIGIDQYSWSVRGPTNEMQLDGSRVDLIIGEEGTYTVTMRAIDTSGNRGVEDFNISVSSSKWVDIAIAGEGALVEGKPGEITLTLENLQNRSVKVVVLVEGDTVFDNFSLPEILLEPGCVKRIIIPMDTAGMGAGAHRVTVECYSNGVRISDSTVTVTLAEEKEQGMQATLYLIMGILVLAILAFLLVLLMMLRNGPSSSYYEE